MYEVPDQSGKTIVITGSNSGLGRETATRLALAGASVVLAVRSVDKGEKVKERILKKRSDANVSVVPLDLADLASVRAAADQLREELPHIDVLINNAGVMTPPSRHTTKDGFELQFGTNYLGHVALAGRLWPLLRKAAEADRAPRVVTLSSVAAIYGKIDFQDLQWESRKYSPTRSYAQSKLADAYLTLQLADFAAKNKDNIISVAAHPGWTKTNLWGSGANLDSGNSIIGFVNKLALIVSQDVQHGADPSLYAAVGPGVKPQDYYGPKYVLKGEARRARLPRASHNSAVSSRLWYTALELTHSPTSFVFD